jgi:hypothetical protein
MPKDGWSQIHDQTTSHGDLNLNHPRNIHADSYEIIRERFSFDSRGTDTAKITTTYT